MSSRTYPNQEWKGLEISNKSRGHMVSRKGRDKHFFLNDEVHTVLSINRGKDRLVAWNHAQRKVMRFNYTTVVNRMEKAFATKEVGAMIGRSYRSIEQAIRHEHIRRPPSRYAMSGDTSSRRGYMWNEKSMMELLDYFAGVHKGRPRKDGAVTPMNLPTPRELRAMIHNQDLTYVKHGEQMVPTWRAPIL